MLDRFFAPMLTFVTLIAGTVGFGAALMIDNGPGRAERVVTQGMSPAIVELERVEVVARRDQLTLPHYEAFGRGQAGQVTRQTGERAPQRLAAAEGHSVQLGTHWE